MLYSANRFEMDFGCDLGSSGVVGMKGWRFLETLS